MIRVQKQIYSLYSVTLAQIVSTNVRIKTSFLGKEKTPPTSVINRDWVLPPLKTAPLVVAVQCFRKLGKITTG